MKRKKIDFYYYTKQQIFVQQILFCKKKIKIPEQLILIKY